MEEALARAAPTREATLLSRIHRRSTFSSSPRVQASATREHLAAASTSSPRTINPQAPIEAALSQHTPLVTTRLTTTTREEALAAHHKPAVTREGAVAEEAEEATRGVITSRSITRRPMMVVLSRQATSNQLSQLPILMIITPQANLTLKRRSIGERKRERIIIKKVTKAPASTPGRSRSPPTMISPPNNSTTLIRIQAIKSLIRAVRGTKNMKRHLKNQRRNITSQKSNRNTARQEIIQSNHPIVVTAGEVRLVAAEAAIIPEVGIPSTHHLTKIAGTTEAHKDMGEAPSQS